MNVNQLDQIIIDENDAIEVLYQNQTLTKIVVSDSIWAEQFNHFCHEFEIPFKFDWELESQTSREQFIENNLADWFLPKEYQSFDILDFLIKKCENDQQVERVVYELDEFAKRDMIDVLVWLKYFVDTLKANNLIWGVGRGSSVSSYVLYLLEVHRIDSIKYDLDIKEFLK